jgi:hypothetical protein
MTKASYPSSMSAQDDHTLINFIAVTVESMRDQMATMATKDDLGQLELRMESRMEALRANLESRMDSMEEQMVTKDALAQELAAIRREMATKYDLARLETRVRGDFEHVHFRFDTLERIMNTRFGQVETDISRLRSVVYLLVKDKPEMLRLLGQPTPIESQPQG